MSTETTCQECGAYHDHSPLCSKNTPEEIKKFLMVYFSEYQRWAVKDQTAQSRCQTRVSEARKEREFWKGKFNEVKHENNELRKQINNLKKSIS